MKNRRMKYVTIAVATILLLFGSLGSASADLTKPSIHLDSTEWSLPTAQEHVSTAQSLAQELAQLQEKVAAMDQKIARYDQKPYLDPKSFRRDGLKRLKGSALKKMATLREQVAWHQAEASRLASLEQSRQEQGLDREESVRGELASPESRATSGNSVGQTSPDAMATQSS